MYNVLLVDDETNILDGISELVNWNACDTHLQGKATNGLMAFEMIEESQPDIIVTDIKMPGMNGIELIEKTHTIYPNIQFIILSGYDEFEYAKTAMRFGAKHYLLKPSNEQKIEDALKQVVAEMKQKDEKNRFEEEVRRSYLPKAKEQLLRELITNKIGVTEWEAHRKFVDLSPAYDNDYGLVVLKLDGTFDYEQLFHLKELVVSKLEAIQPIILSTILSDYVVMLGKNYQEKSLRNNLYELIEAYKQENNVLFSASISRKGNIADLHKIYNEALEYLRYKFYLGKGSIITPNQLYNRMEELKELHFDHETFLREIKRGDVDKVRGLLYEFFSELRKSRFDVDSVRYHCLGIFMLISRQVKGETKKKLLAKLTLFNEFTTLDEMEAFIMDIAIEIAFDNAEEKRKSQHKLVRKIEEYVLENLHDDTLSITKIANEIFYMHPDYLGKLFKKETGEKFSIYLIKRRVERAIELFRESDEISVQEVAEEVGFGKNPRYFGQVFKKHTGYTPSSYRKIVS
ncbi:response regulator [Aquibacillus salsiterrae]|uniref:Response regulator n=1 Tax=Aquibacillus salsiterrae TaxID=2950439 RepID=A0A9X3WB00_9BACI|nr:response regulator [Aquibacillus salsiterrae]MDC3416087.1 response regulator [Aquibacillus salsiterrae]